MIKSNGMYILKGELAIPVSSAREWGEWFENSNDRFLARTTIDDIMVSTVFLGVDYNFGGVGDPLLFETMIFAGDDYSDTVEFEFAKNEHSFWGSAKRDSFYGEAIATHHQAVEEIRKRLEGSKRAAERMIVSITVTKKAKVDE